MLGMLAGALSGIFSSGAKGVIDSVGDAIDKNVTSDKERGEIKLALQNSLQDFQTAMEVEATKQEETLTERWKADAASDSWLTRNIRPLALIHCFLLLDVAIAFALAGVTLPEAWISLLTTLLVTIVAAYFGGRTAEKGITKWRKG